MIYTDWYVCNHIQGMQLQNCDGTGRCMYQVNGNNYFRDRDCVHNCQLVECPNYRMCRSKRPMYILHCHGGRCLHCNMLFGRNLEFVNEKDECSVCLDNKSEFVKMPNCTHKLCCECFRNNEYHHVSNYKEAKLVDKEPESKKDSSDESSEVVDNEPPEYAGKCPICRQSNHIKWKQREKKN